MKINSSAPKMATSYDTRIKFIYLKNRTKNLSRKSENHSATNSKIIVDKNQHDSKKHIKILQILNNFLSTKGFWMKNKN